MLVGMTNGRRTPASGEVSASDLTLLIALACAAMLPLLLLDDRVPPFGDHDFHTVNAARAAVEMEHGSLYPRWFWQGHLGLGEPTLLYYAPAFPLASGLLTLTGFDPWTAVRLTGAFGVLLLGVTVLWTLSRALSPRAAWVGVCLAMLNPLALHALYFTGYWPMYLSQIPAFWLIWNSLARPPRLALTAILLCVTALFHPLMAFMLILTLPPAVAFQGWSDGNRATVALLEAARLSAGLALGAALSAFYLAPALLRQDLISDWESAPAENAWVFAFPVISEVLWPARHIIAPLPLVAGLAAAAVSGLGEEPQARRLGIGFLALGAPALLLATELAWPLYHPQLLGRLQFAWRFLFVAGLGAALALTVSYASARRRSWVAVPGAVAFWLALGTATGGYFFYRVTFHKRALPTLATTLETYIGQPEYFVSAAGEHWREYVHRGGFAAECSDKGAACRLEIPAGREKCWTIESAEPATLIAPVFTMEGMEASWDGRQLKLGRDPATGLARVETPGGSGRLCFQRRALPEERAGIWVSLLALGAVALLWRRERR